MTGDLQHSGFLCSHHCDEFYPVNSLFIEFPTGGSGLFEWYVRIARLRSDRKLIFVWRLYLLRLETSIPLTDIARWTRESS